VSETTAVADEGRGSQRTHRLPGVLFVAGTEAFVTALILFSGEPAPAWFLYLIPITIGALTHGVAGSVTVWAISAGVLVLAAPAGTLGDDWATFVTGFCVFLASGIVTGMQSHRLSAHAAVLEATSPFDPLTGAYKREQFLTRLSAETARSDRYGHSTGLVVVRVEDFDEFTRAFGRFKADAMLDHLADVIRLSVRSTDTIGRLSPTEFGVILPHARSDEARSTAERITTVLAETRFEGDALEPATTCITVAASAAYPADASSHTGLLEVAMSRLPGNGGDPAVPGAGTSAS